MTGEGAGAASGPGPELIMVAHAGADLRVQGSRVLKAATETGPLTRALAETGAQVRPLFALTEDRLRTTRRNSPVWLPDLSIYYRVDAPSDHEGVAARLAQEDAIDGAYVKPAPVTGLEGFEPTASQGDTGQVSATAGAASAAPASTTPAGATGTPDFTAQQGYLGAPPGGLNASAQWSQAGGDGTNVQVILVGGSWQTSHEDLVGAIANGGTPIDGTPIDALSYRNHGTAMFGVIRADRNTIGVTGIAPAAQVSVLATFGVGTAPAIHEAADHLPVGGIIGIEWQRPGPGSTGVGSAGFIPLEWWPEDFAAMTYATQKNVIVVAPAGNGSISLDDPVYDTPAPGFPGTWRNPFNKANQDSGAVIVGAGAPPSGNHGPDRSRLTYSNYGSRVNVQGWGEEIVTTGYGDLSAGTGENQFYTNTFQGTSGAAAMVAGALAVLQGVEIAGAKRGPLTPPVVRQLLNNQTVSAQQDGGTSAPVTQRIGPRPELGAWITAIGPSKDESKEAKDAKEPKDNKDNKEKAEKEQKEQKEHKETKDNKDNKDNPEIKTRKDHKDQKHEKIETKEALAAKDKDAGHVDPFVGVGLSAATALQFSDPAVSTAEPVQHFIEMNLRPNLTVGALLAEADMEASDPDELARRLAPPAASAIRDSGGRA